MRQCTTSPQKRRRTQEALIREGDKSDAALCIKLWKRCRRTTPDRFIREFAKRIGEEESTVRNILNKGTTAGRLTYWLPDQKKRGYFDLSPAFAAEEPEAEFVEEPPMAEADGSAPRPEAEAVETDTVPVDETEDEGEALTGEGALGEEPEAAQPEQQPEAVQPQAETPPPPPQGGRKPRKGQVQQGEELRPEQAEAGKKPAGAMSVAEAILDKHPVVEQIPVEGIEVNKAIRQFKRGADLKTGVVPESRLEGQWSGSLGRAIRVIEFKDGRREVITGRHRLDLARRNGMATIPAIVYREADGMTVEKAHALDAIENVMDGKGTTRDYIRFFAETSDLTDAELRDLGVTTSNNERVRNAFDIARKGIDELRVEALNAERIPLSVLGAIARSDKRVQLALLDDVRKHDTRDPTQVMMMGKLLAQGIQNGETEQLELFGEDDEAMRDMRALAIGVARVTSQMRKDLSIVRGVINKEKDVVLRDETAKRLGITDKNDMAELHQAKERLEQEIREYESPTISGERREKALAAGREAIKREEAHGVQGTLDFSGGQSKPAPRPEPKPEKKPESPKPTPQAKPKTEPMSVSEGTARNGRIAWRGKWLKPGGIHGHQGVFVSDTEDGEPHIFYQTEDWGLGSNETKRMRRGTSAVDHYRAAVTWKDAGMPGLDEAKAQLPVEEVDGAVSEDGYIRWEKFWLKPGTHDGQEGYFIHDERGGKAMSFYKPGPWKTKNGKVRPGKVTNFVDDKLTGERVNAVYRWVKHEKMLEEQKPASAPGPKPQPPEAQEPAPTPRVQIKDWELGGQGKPYTRVGLNGREREDGILWSVFDHDGKHYLEALDTKANGKDGIVNSATLYEWHNGGWRLKIENTDRMGTDGKITGEEVEYASYFEPSPYHGRFGSWKYRVVRRSGTAPIGENATRQMNNPDAHKHGVETLYNADGSVKERRLYRNGNRLTQLGGMPTDVVMGWANAKTIAESGVDNAKLAETRERIRQEFGADVIPQDAPVANTPQASEPAPTPATQEKPVATTKPAPSGRPMASDETIERVKNAIDKHYGAPVTNDPHIIVTTPIMPDIKEPASAPAQKPEPATPQAQTSSDPAPAPQPAQAPTKPTDPKPAPAEPAKPKVEKTKDEQEADAELEALLNDVGMAREPPEENNRPNRRIRSRQETSHTAASPELNPATTPSANQSNVRIVTNVLSDLEGKIAALERMHETLRVPAIRGGTEAITPGNLVVSVASNIGLKRDVPASWYGTFNPIEHTDRKVTLRMGDHPVSIKNVELADNGKTVSLVVYGERPKRKALEPTRQDVVEFRYNKKFLTSERMRAFINDVAALLRTGEFANTSNGNRITPPQQTGSLREGPDLSSEQRNKISLAVNKVVAARVESAGVRTFRDLVKRIFEQFRDVNRKMWEAMKLFLRNAWNQYADEHESLGLDDVSRAEARAIFDEVERGDAGTEAQTQEPKAQATEPETPTQQAPATPQSTPSAQQEPQHAVEPERTESQQGGVIKPTDADYANAKDGDVIKAQGANGQRAALIKWGEYWLEPAKRTVKVWVQERRGRGRYKQQEREGVNIHGRARDGRPIAAVYSFWEPRDEWTSSKGKTHYGYLHDLINYDKSYEVWNALDAWGEKDMPGLEEARAWMAGATPAENGTLDTETQGKEADNDRRTDVQPEGGEPGGGVGGQEPAGNGGDAGRREATIDASAADGHHGDHVWRLGQRDKREWRPDVRGRG